jgi:hypothetical protein
MTTSGTATFNLDLNSLVEEAFERCGEELRTGYDLRTARRSLNLLTIEWANRGINLWTLEQGSIAMVAGTISYNLPVDTIDLLDTIMRTGSGTTQADISVFRISASSYSTIPNKNVTGRPTQVWIDRQSGATDPSSGIMYPTVNVWPVPDVSTYTLVYWRLRRIQDIGRAGTLTPDIPFRFLPALVAGLAFYLSLKLPGAVERIPLLKSEYGEQMTLAMEEDREKASLYIVPRIARV